MLIADKWDKDQYELIDAGDGEKLERWGGFVLRRPDPQVIWPAFGGTGLWDSAQAWYHRSSAGGGSWEYRSVLPASWTVSYGNLNFIVRPTTFKHTGLFPEQAVNWDWMAGKIKDSDRKISVLNLFAYTGGATVACASAGAEVCHVDAAKGMVEWAKVNIVKSKLTDSKVRFLVDDVFKFIQRENRRGNKYDAIIMDPPSYGRGPGGEIWKIEDSLYSFISECMGLLSEKPLFFLINSYTTGFSPGVLKNILQMAFKNKPAGVISAGELGIGISASGLTLPCGIYGRWED